MTINDESPYSQEDLDAFADDFAHNIREANGHLVEALDCLGQAGALARDDEEFARLERLGGAINTIIAELQETRIIQPV